MPLTNLLCDLSLLAAANARSARCSAEMVSQMRTAPSPERDADPSNLPFAMTASERKASVWLMI
jgi:hypothetical protein